VLCLWTIYARLRATKGGSLYNHTVEIEINRKTFLASRTQRDDPGLTRLQYRPCLSCRYKHKQSAKITTTRFAASIVLLPPTGRQSFQFTPYHISTFSHFIFKCKLINSCIYLFYSRYLEIQGQQGKLQDKLVYHFLCKPLQQYFQAMQSLPNWKTPHY